MPRITQRKVDEIRNLYDCGTMTLAEIARAVGVSGPTASRYINDRTIRNRTRTVVAFYSSHVHLIRNAPSVDEAIATLIEAIEEAKKLGL